METDKPLISILMAVYEPRMDWLREQLTSLNAQTYPNLRLYIRDDCSPTVPLEDIRRCAEECVRAFPFELRRNERNLGSNGTFERLTLEAEGELFAYCDQDDVWLPEKLAVLQAALESRGAALACSDMYIIDGEGKRTADSITKVRRHHVFRSGKGLAPALLISNFVTGCTMLMRADAARAASPFCPYMVHDHYLALYAGAGGEEIVSLPERLISYRIHGGNQTGLMAGVDSRESYTRVRIDALVSRLEWLRDNLPNQDEDLQKAIDERLIWANARHRNMTGAGGKKDVWKYRRFGLLPSLFEVAAPHLPDGLFRLAVSLARHNYV